MTGKSKKASSSPSSTAAKKRKQQEMLRSNNKKKKGGGGGGAKSTGGFSENKAEKLFQQIADPDDPHIANMEGICTFCEKLGIDPLEDIRVLVLLWKMGATQKPAQISKTEWMDGCRRLRVDSVAGFKSLLPSLDTGFLDQEEFKDLYKFCFTFNLQGTHRTLDKEMVVALLSMILKGRIPADRLETFCTFCEGQESYNRITLDQWTSFLDFCHEVEDLSMYDESSSAWPVLIDEYVEYMEEQQKKK